MTALGEPLAKKARPYARIGGRAKLVPKTILENALGRSLAPEMLTRHLCGNHHCCNPGHLREGTAAENHADTVRHGRYVGNRSGPLNLITRLLEGIDFRGPDECWPWIKGTDEHGYGRLRREGRNAKASRIMLEMSLERPLATKEYARHRCDNPACCNPAHLRVGSQADNMGEAKQRRRLASGEAHHASKLSDSQIEEARALYAKGDVSHQALAERYGISRKAMERGIRGIDRKYAPGQTVSGLAPQRLTKGEQNSKAVLTEAKVRDIRELHVLGKSLEELARLYQVDPTTVAQIVQGRTWKHVDGPTVAARTPMSAADARRIREQFAAGGVHKLDLAAQEGCSLDAIQAILHGRSFKSAGGPTLERWQKCPVMAP